jgi:hypothetical protein
MATYSNEEYTDMHWMYSKADGNSRAARRLYEERFPDRRIPDSRIFSNIHRRLRENGSFETKRNNAGRNEEDRTENILNAFEQDPSSSTRKVAAELNLSQWKVWKTMNKQGLHPYHLTKVQALQPEDFPRRRDFCRWVLHKINGDENFIKRILWSDEAGFTREGYFNCRNEHIWAYDNPHAVKVMSHQVRFSLNVWAGIVDNYLIGPVFLPRPLNGASYLQFLQNEFQNLLADTVPLLVRQRMYFMQDGAPPHFAVTVRQHLDMVFGQRWIGRGGPVAWPPRSPDITPCDFWLWVHVKAEVYKTEIIDINDLRNKIINAFNTVREKIGVFDRMRNSLCRRLHACIEANGEHFEHLL